MRLVLAYLLAGNITMIAVLGTFDMGSTKPGNVVPYVLISQLGTLVWPLALAKLIFDPPSFERSETCAT